MFVGSTRKLFVNHCDIKNKTMAVFCKLKQTVQNNVRFVVVVVVLLFYVHGKHLWSCRGDQLT